MVGAAGVRTRLAWGCRLGPGKRGLRNSQHRPMGATSAMSFLSSDTFSFLAPLAPSRAFLFLGVEHGVGGVLSSCHSLRLSKWSASGCHSLRLLGHPLT